MFSKRIAFNYLEDLAQEFYNNYGRKINTVTRPYQFIGEIINDDGEESKLT